MWAMKATPYFYHDPQYTREYNPTNHQVYSFINYMQPQYITEIILQKPLLRPPEYAAPSYKLVSKPH